MLYVMLQTAVTQTTFLLENYSGILRIFLCVYDVINSSKLIREPFCVMKIFDRKPANRTA